MSAVPTPETCKALNDEGHHQALPGELIEAIVERLSTETKGQVCFNVGIYRDHELRTDVFRSSLHVSPAFPEEGASFSIYLYEENESLAEALGRTLVKLAKAQAAPAQAGRVEEAEEVPF